MKVEAQERLGRKGTSEGCNIKGGLKGQDAAIQYLAHHSTLAPEGQEDGAKKFQSGFRNVAMRASHSSVTSPGASGAIETHCKVCRGLNPPPDKALTST